MKLDARVGLQNRVCGRCRWRGYGSAGERCPNCGAYSEEYGPVFFGREQHWATMARGVVDGPPDIDGSPPTELVHVHHVSLAENDNLEPGSFVLVEIWRPRREPWNHQWVGPPAERARY